MLLGLLYDCGGSNTERAQTKAASFCVKAHTWSESNHCRDPRVRWLGQPLALKALLPPPPHPITPRAESRGCQPPPGSGKAWFSFPASPLRHCGQPSTTESWQG